MIVLGFVLGVVVVMFINVMLFKEVVFVWGWWLLFLLGIFVVLVGMLICCWLEEMFDCCDVVFSYVKL